MTNESQSLFRGKQIFNAPAPTRQNDHLGKLRGSLVQKHIRLYGNAVRADDPLSADADELRLDFSSSKQVARDDGFGFFKSIGKQNINHV